MKTAGWTKQQRKSIATIALAAATMLLPAGAQAGSQSNLTLGLGSSIGLSHVVPVTGGMHNTVLSEMNLRLKLLKVVGLDLNYNLSGEQPVGHGEVYSSNLRVSALLYVIPTKRMSVYLAGGTGASSFSDLTSKSVSKKSFHGGGGMELYVGRHLAFTTEFLFLVPEVEKVVVTVQPLRVDGSSSVDLGSIETPSASDYLSTDNYQFTFGLKYYF